MTHGREGEDAVAFAFLQPIAVLVRELASLDVDAGAAGAGAEHFRSPVTLERSLASGVFPLAITYVEAGLRWFEERAGRSGSNRRVVLVLREYYRRPDLADLLDELYVVRETIVHSQVWHRAVAYTTKGEPRFTFGPFRPLDGIGDRRFRKMVDPETQATRLLDIPVVPERIRREHVWRFLGACVEILREVEITHLARYGDVDGDAHVVTDLPVQIGEQVMPFSRLVDGLVQEGRVPGWG
ncbi:MAG TPA: hypothetical protein VGB42_09995 [Candidatus Thermoplasmatota archaeon]